MTYSEIVLVGYLVMSAIPFFLMGGLILPDSFPGIKVEDCGHRNRGPCVDSFEFGVGKIYMQVAAAFMLQNAALIYFKGDKKGIITALGCLMAVMAKHILVDGLIPPPPVMVLTTLVLAAQFFAPGEWGKRAFVLYMLLNVVVFTTDPATPLKDTYPTIEQNAMALFVGERFIEVIALHCLINALLAGIPGKQLALALSMTLILPLMGYHAFVHSVGPPGPMLLINLAISALTWIEYGWADLTKKAEAEMKTPMYIHGVIVSTSFVPYYIAEAMGMPFPLVGLKELDPTTPDPSPMTQFTYFFVALFMAMYSYTEIKGTMEGKVFAVYHYALSCIIAMWQFYPTTTLLGRLFFSLPHAFTLWSTFIVLKEHEKVL
ncbi:hypothetical protein EMIHUDRAFT_210736 [Emiliania huxleyi CCMP1516]|uniref:Uncharacterized protein n=4 Tax=Emiliania huxleyi TaxID=2903 RepID=A0A0D3IYM5_EMIH1|nr:hypothetical protein EMIHUDRAFT_210736 [Emiliania huxleyi CCMP1516]EOD16360.1 hypothetical protein EMIHUDRAFT_210736 [Emiliania huxleyi CCMP1516]|eukprot:XP_005768789.1 hypothetical protein EMIHUDRAFT_210736 [Emiliania huxleyi CCMP1516]